MKILHVCTCGPFTDGLSYQENELIEQHVTLGHDVTVIAATDTFSAEKKFTHAPPGISLLRCGAKLIRLPYHFGKLTWLASKIRLHRGLTAHLDLIRPDRILFHGLVAWDLLTVARYVKKNSHVKLFADCHEDFNNSAMTWASRELLHKRFYKPIFRRSVAQIDEILCVTVESLDFAIDFYESPRAKTRIYPLGGIIESNADRECRRRKFRMEYGLNEDDLIIVQTGKLNANKGLIDALIAFKTITVGRFRFIIAGQMTDEVHRECWPLVVSDPRIVYLGWQSTGDLRTVLAGADFFLQPFGQTVTTQMAMCHGCVVLAQDLPSHRWLVRDHGFLFRDASELKGVMAWVIENEFRLEEMKNASLQFAKENLDYRKLAQQIVY